MNSSLLWKLPLLFIVGGMVGTLVNDRMPAFLQKSSENQIVAAPPPCTATPVNSTRLIVYRKNNGDAQPGLQDAKLFVQKEDVPDHPNASTGSTNSNGVFLSPAVVAFGDHPQRVMAISPDQTDTTVVYVRSCSGVEEISIPVKAN